MAVGMTQMEQLERELERSRLGRSVVESLEADKRQLESKLAELRASAPVSANGKSALASSLGGSSGGGECAQLASNAAWPMPLLCRQKLITEIK